MTKWNELTSDAVIQARCKAKAKSGATTYTVADGRGLMLVVTEKGAARRMVWRFQYKRPASGKTNNLTFGEYFAGGGGVGIAQAREKAQEARESLAQGVDPAEERDSAREVAEVAAKVEAEDAQRAKDGKHVRGTFAAEVDDWAEFKSASIGAETLKRQKRHLEKHAYPLIGSMRLGEIRNSNLLPLVESLTKKKNFEILCQVLWLVREVFERALQHDRVEFNPIHKPSPDILNKRRTKRVHHAAHVEPEKLAEVIKAVRNRTEDRQTTDSVMIGAYTLQRVGSIVAMRWADIDLDGATWAIPPEFMKLKREQKESGKTKAHIVPLPRQVVSILRRRRADQKQTVQWVFPNERDSSRPACSDSPGAALRRLGFTGTHTMHGFRAAGRTVGQFYADLDGIILETQLAHKNPTGIAGASMAGELADGGLGETYLRKGEFFRTEKQVEARRVTMQKWADFLDNISDIPAGGLRLAA